MAFHGCLPCCDGCLSLHLALHLPQSILSGSSKAAALPVPSPTQGSRAQRGIDSVARAVTEPATREVGKRHLEGGLGAGVWWRWAEDVPPYRAGGQWPGAETPALCDPATPQPSSAALQLGVSGCCELCSPEFLQ